MGAITVSRSRAIEADLVIRQPEKTLCCAVVPIDFHRHINFEWLKSS